MMSPLLRADKMSFVTLRMATQCCKKGDKQPVMEKLNFRVRREVDVKETLTKDLSRRAHLIIYYVIYSTPFYELQNFGHFIFVTIPSPATHTHSEWECLSISFSIREWRVSRSLTFQEITDVNSII